MGQNKNKKKGLDSPPCHRNRRSKQNAISSIIRHITNVFCQHLHQQCLLQREKKSEMIFEISRNEDTIKHIRKICLLLFLDLFFGCLYGIFTHVI